MNTTPCPWCGEPKNAQGICPGCGRFEPPRGLVMSKFRRRPLIFEAVRYNGTLEGLPPEILLVISVVKPDGTCLLETAQGSMECRSGDWIIKSSRGEFHACRNDVFQETYDPIDGD